jgi:hypothetical protein
MVETDTYQKQRLLEKRERIATVCALCVWVVVLAFCWPFLTDELLQYDYESAFAYMVMWLFVMAIFLISIYKIGRAILNLYKHR